MIILAKTSIVSKLPRWPCSKENSAKTEVAIHLIIHLIKYSHSGCLLLFNGVIWLLSLDLCVTFKSYFGQTSWCFTYIRYEYNCFVQFALALFICSIGFKHLSKIYLLAAKFFLPLRFVSIWSFIALSVVYYFPSFCNRWICLFDLWTLLTHLAPWTNKFQMYQVHQELYP